MRHWTPASKTVAIPILVVPPSSEVQGHRLGGPVPCTRPGEITASSEARIAALGPSGPPPESGATKVWRGERLVLTKSRVSDVVFGSPASIWIERRTGLDAGRLLGRRAKSQMTTWRAIGRFDRYVWREGSPQFAGVVVVLGNAFGHLQSQSSPLGPTDGTPFHGTLYPQAIDLTGIGE